MRSGVLGLGATASLFHHLAWLFASSMQIGCIPAAWKLAALRGLLEPGRLPSLATGYGPIGLVGSVMRLFGRVVGRGLRSYLGDMGFMNECRSGFGRNGSADDHLFRLSRSVMEGFSGGEHVVAAFLGVEGAFDNVWHNGLRYKIVMLYLPTHRPRYQVETYQQRPSERSWTGKLESVETPTALAQR